MPETTPPGNDPLWHPFTQMLDWTGEPQLTVERAEGTDLIDDRGRRYIDGVSSPWCNVHGHRHPRIDAAIRDQLERVAHTTLLGLSHPGAAELATRLTEISPPGLTRVFFSESGSTATEIALKMAFQHWQQRGGVDRRRKAFVCLEGGYHGDTVGAVSVGGIDLFHGTYGPLLFESHRAAAGDAADMERVLATHGERVAAVIVEPLVQGAGGMIVHPRGYLRDVRELCDRYGVPLICDEVATGFGRTGTMFACEQEGVSPDFLCLGKGLTGGYLPLAATLTTDDIYSSFLGEHADFRTFFHGHTYTGNPLACAAALASLEVFEEEQTLAGLRPKMGRLAEMLDSVAEMPEVSEVRHRGLMVGIDLGNHDPQLRLGHRVTLEARSRGAIIRPLGDVVVLMPPLAISLGDLETLVEITAESIRAATAAVYQDPSLPAAA
jgi:adenosylmethionine-8-amino-7-oxononanoate aminotransferase